MTWLGDKVKLPQAEADKLIAKREQLMAELKEMTKKNGTFRSQAAANFHAEDMQKKAKQITSIDKKLGRI